MIETNGRITKIDLENGDRLEIEYTDDIDPHSEYLLGQDVILVTFIRRGRRTTLTKTLDGLRNLIEGLVNTLIQPMEWDFITGSKRLVRAEEVDTALELYAHTVAAQKVFREANERSEEEENQ